MTKSTPTRLHKAIQLILVFALSVPAIYSCKKDNTDDIQLPTPQRTVKIIGFESDYFDCIEEFSYTDDKLATYDYYRMDVKGDWVHRNKYLYEYPSDDIIIEYSQKQIDSVWTTTSKWEKIYSNDNLIERTKYNFNVNTGWHPDTRLEYTSMNDELSITNSFVFKDGNWSALSRKIFYYEDGRCIKTLHLFNSHGVWDSIGMQKMFYTGANLTLVENYSHQTGSNSWMLISNYEMEYVGAQLISRDYNSMWEGELHWGHTYSMIYNAYGNPETYTFTADFLTKDIQVFYEVGTGNLQQAVTENPAYHDWAWLPQPE